MTQAHPATLAHRERAAQLAADLERAADVKASTLADAEAMKASAATEHERATATARATYNDGENAAYERIARGAAEELEPLVAAHLAEDTRQTARAVAECVVKWSAEAQNETGQPLSAWVLAGVLTALHLKRKPLALAEYGYFGPGASRPGYAEAQQAVDACLRDAPTGEIVEALERVEDAVARLTVARDPSGISPEAQEVLDAYRFKRPAEWEPLFKKLQARIDERSREATRQLSADIDAARHGNARDVELDARRGKRWAQGVREKMGLVGQRMKAVVSG